MIFQGKFQIGKNGLTSGVIDSLNMTLTTHNQIRISVLKSATRDKEEIKEIAEEILMKVNYKCRYRILGFTIIVRKESSKKLNKESL